jgi:hypothetical protein
MEREKKDMKKGGNIESKAKYIKKETRYKKK